MARSPTKCWCACGSSSRSSCTSSRVPTRSPHRRREPAPGIFRLTLPLPFPGLHRVNAYALVQDDGITLADCGINDPGLGDDGDGSFNELVAALDAAGLSLDDVKRLVITHPHLDHYGL